jgi:response regulator RpfG family c-di-GMP phosphodiesterase
MNKETEPMYDAQSDELLLAPETTDADGSAFSAQPWKVLVVDDEPEIHRVTRMVMDDLRFEGRGLEMIHALSGAEAREIMARTDDIAVILLDVVMETEDSGLQFVKFVRDELANPLVRIILRTGQAGAAPERSVIIDYDINDYKSKSELTAQKLFTTVVSALRGYRGIITIERSRRGLEKVIDASAPLFEKRTAADFFAGILYQLCALLNVGEDTFLASGSMDEPEPVLLTGTGRFANAIGRRVSDLDKNVHAAVNWSFENRANGFFPDRCAVFFQARGNKGNVAYIEGVAEMDEVDRQLVDLFCMKAAIAFDNVQLFDQLHAAQEATVIALAKLAEFKDTDTADHLRRVERMTLATTEELIKARFMPEVVDETLLHLIGMASILHDVGKVGTPDDILGKKGPLNDSEWVVMQRHALAGGVILGEAARLVRGRTYLSVGAEIASAHHEHWDGGGYPNRLAGEAIPVSARIVAICDVYDALVSKRAYKDPWKHEDAIDWIVGRRDTHFQSEVVDAFLVAIEALRAQDLRN